MSNIDQMSIIKIHKECIQSDHSAIQMILRKYLIKYISREMHKGEIDKDRIKDDKRINKAFNNCFEEKWNENTSYEDFCDLMLEAARTTASHPIKISKSWFQHNKEELTKVISERNEILHKTINGVLNEEELEKRKREL